MFDMPFELFEVEELIVEEEGWIGFWRGRKKEEERDIFVFSHGFEAIKGKMVILGDFC